VLEFTEKVLRSYVTVEQDCVRLELVGTKILRNLSSYVILSKVSDLSVCPVRACSRFVSSRYKISSTNVAFFRCVNGSWYAAKEASSTITALAFLLKWDCRVLSSHSLHIGGAIEAARAGVITPRSSMSWGDGSRIA
jgi:hypothetical protein